MILIKQSGALSRHLAHERSKGHSIGFVPTMGALHQGHLSLIEKALQHSDLAVCSIFVNPTQFNDTSDFEKYPVTIEQDVLLLEKAGCHVLFLPAVAELYPDGTQRKHDYDLGYLGTVYEGAYRPGHFQGVWQVVEKLLNLVRPNHLYLGQKDYQQCEIIKQQVQQSGWDIDMEVIVCPTLREPDGLAMSSRNRRINEVKRSNADGMFKALSYIKNNIREYPVPQLIAGAKTIMEAKGFDTEYLDIIDGHTMRPITEYNNNEKIVAVTAGVFDDVRLIDNMVISENT